MGYIQDNGIIFYNTVYNGVFRKIGKSTTNDPNLSFITKFKNPDILNEILNDLDSAINGNFDLINDPDVSNNDDIAFISPTGVDFYDRDGQNILGSASLEDFRELIVAWKAFLLQPPLNGVAE